MRHSTYLHLTLLCFWGLIGTCVAQTPEKQSLTQQLNQFEDFIQSFKYDSASVSKLQIDELLATQELVNDTLLIRFYSLQAQFYTQKANYTQAEQVALACLDICKKTETTTSLYCTNALYYQALAYLSMHRHDEALPLFSEAISQFTNLGNIAQQELAAAHRRISVVYRQQRDFEQANTHLDTALHIYQNMTPPDSSGLADTYISKALTQEARGVSLDSAYLLYQQAKQIYTAIYGNDHPQVAKALDYMGRNLLQQSKFDEAIVALIDAKTIYTSVNGKNHSTVARMYYFLGMAFARIDQPEEAIEATATSLAIHLLTGEGKNLNARNCNNLLGNLYRHKGDYKASLRSFEAALQIQHIIFGEGKQEDTGVILDNMGITVESQGDNELAALYFQSGLQLKIDIFGHEHDRVAESWHSLGNNQSKRGLHAEALQSLAKAESIYVNHHSDTAFYELGGLYQNIGLVYKEMQSFEDALSYYQKALVNYQNTVGLSHYNVAILKQRIAALYKAQNLPETALEEYHSALRIMLESRSWQHAETANILCQLGEVHLMLHQLDSTRHYLAKAQYALGYQPDKPQLFDQIIKPTYLYKTFEVFSEYYQKQYEHSWQQNYLDSLDLLYDDWLALLNFIQLQPLTNETRLNYQAEIVPIVEGAIKNKLKRPAQPIRHEEVFQLIERAKARQLTTHLQSKTIDAAYSFGIPDTLIRREQQLSIDLAYYQQKKHNRLSATVPLADSLLIRYDRQIRELTQAKIDLQKQFKTNFPQYYNWRYQPHILTLKTLQDSILEDDETFLSFFWGHEKIYLFLVQQNNYRLLEFEEDDIKQLCQQLEELLQHQNNLFTNQTTNSSAAIQVKNYTEVAQALYSQLLAPVEGILTDHLIICPDKLLGAFPFEILLTDTSVVNLQNFAAYPYLVKKRIISYAYSASSYYQSQQQIHKTAPTKPLLVMAPFSKRAYKYQINTLGYHAISNVYAEHKPEESIYLPVLPRSAEAAQQISAIWQGKTQLDTFATKKSFVEQNTQFNILHLITHGSLNYHDNNFSFLAFAQNANSPDSDEILYLNEIYNLKLKAQLVVLSACETGIGKYQVGEGIYSLAHAFFYAGARSLAVSFWSVEDNTTKDLMVSFHQYLKQGLAKDEALQKAKLAYLEANPGFQSHPFFWGGIITIGDRSPIHMP